MKTLGKKITQRFFLVEDGFSLMRKRWSELVNTGHKPSSTELLLYMILRGRDYRKAFSPVTNETKLFNGQNPNQGLNSAMGRLRHKKTLEEMVKTLFDGIVSPEVVTDTVRFLTPSKDEPYNDMIAQDANASQAA